MIPDLIKQYVDTGKARFVYREFPLAQLHPTAPKASEAALCAGQMGKYWEMNERLFESVGEWSIAEDPTVSFKAYAEELGLDSDEFAQCLDSGETAAFVQGELLAGEMFGVNATPYFFINDIPIRGGLPVEALGQIIDYVAAGGPMPEIVPVDGDWRVRGDLGTARAVTVAFVDFASPESGEHVRDVMPQLVEQYVDSGQMLYVLHPWSQGDGSSSELGASAAECAGQQGKYWEMAEGLFEEQDTWAQAADPGPLFSTYADDLELDAGEFESCLDSDWAKLRVQAGNVVGALYGVPSAPLYLFNNGQGLDGAPTLEEFESTIDSIIDP